MIMIMEIFQNSIFSKCVPFLFCFLCGGSLALDDKLWLFGSMDSLSFTVCLRNSIVTEAH